MECGVVETEAKREKGRHVVRLVPPVPDVKRLGWRAVIRHGVDSRILTKSGHWLRGETRRERNGQSARWIDGTGEDGGDSPPILLPGIPSLEDPGDAVEPGHHDGSSGVKDHDRR